MKVCFDGHSAAPTETTPNNATDSGPLPLLRSPTNIFITSCTYVRPYITIQNNLTIYVVVTYVRTFVHTYVTTYVSMYVCMYIANIIPFYSTVYTHKIILLSCHDFISSSQ